MSRIGIAFALFLALGARATAHENWCGYDYTQIGVPNESGDVNFTGLNDINNRRLIIGGFEISASPHGYVLNGALFQQAINVPGSLRTHAHSINNRGDMVGTTQGPPTYESLAFHRDPAGNYRTFAAPTASATDAWGISTNGRIVGSYRSSTGEHGFLWDGSTFQTIDAPFAERTLLMGINKFNDIVGRSVDNAGVTVSSFLLSNGVFTPVEIVGKDATLVSDINDRGDIVGSYLETDPASLQQVTRGFVIEDGVATLIDAPFPNTQITQVNGINNRGELVGDVFADGRDVGFVAVPRKCGTAPPTNADLDD